jgi:pilus assembly protein Flp/PilA
VTKYSGSAGHTGDAGDGKGSDMTNFVSRFAKDESGATAIEYGLIAALIAVVIISAVTALGSTIKTKFNAVVTGMGGTAGE